MVIGESETNPSRLPSNSVIIKKYNKLRTSEAIQGAGSETALEKPLNITDLLHFAVFRVR